MCFGVLLSLLYWANFEVNTEPNTKYLHVIFTFDWWLQQGRSIILLVASGYQAITYHPCWRLLVIMNCVVKHTIPQPTFYKIIDSIKALLATKYVKFQKESTLRLPYYLFQQLCIWESLFNARQGIVLTKYIRLHQL